MNSLPAHVVGGAAAVVGGAVALWIVQRLWLRAELSLTKHRSLEGHPRWARRLARWLPNVDYDEQQFFAADGAPPDIESRRRAAFACLEALFQTRFAKSAQLTDQAATVLADLQLTARCRVPFQFSRRVRQSLKGGSMVLASHGVSVTDADGNDFYDLTGSYGVNVFGNDFYKGCIERGSAAVRDLGPVLGALHPLVLDNVRRLRELSAQEEISFHMSGTEAVMQAVRLARYHTRRRYAVRFCGAYHGWWGDVQPGVGNPLPADDTFTLRDMSEAALRLLRHRRDIACVLVNPLQSLHPNRGAPADSGLIDGLRAASFDRERYADWLRRLRAVCSERHIPLIIDDVFMGFRLARGGSQEYFGVHADLVTYGKTVAGGLPIGVVAGSRELMRRYREDRPADLCFARGTFNSHPYVMGAMNEFLRALDGEWIQSLYRGLDERWNERAAALNAALEAAQFPVRIASLSTVWTILYTQPSRYHWMLQYYLRAHGLALSWVGTGRIIFSLNFSADDFAAVQSRFLAAAADMRRDGWWWSDTTASARRFRRQVLREALQARCSSIMGSISSPRSR